MIIVRKILQIKKDFKRQAQEILGLIRATGKISFLQAVDAYRGSKNQMAMEFCECENYGKGKELKKSIVERIVQNLLANGNLVNKISSVRGSKFSHSYLSFAKRQIGKVELVMDDNEEEYVKRRESKPTKTKKTSSIKKTNKFSSNSVPVPKKISRSKK